MDAKEFLEQYRSAKRRCEVLHDALSRLQVDLYSSPKFDALPGPKGQVATPVQDLAEKRVDLMMRLQDEQDKQLDVMDQILSVIMQLDGPECELLTLRYIDMLMWDDISERMHYSRRRLFDIHTDALSKVQSILDKRLH